MQLMPNLSTKMDELTLLEISIYSRINNKLSHMHKRTQELACECVMFEGQCSDWAVEFRGVLTHTRTWLGGGSVCGSLIGYRLLRRSD